MSNESKTNADTTADGVDSTEEKKDENQKVDDTTQKTGDSKEQESKVAIDQKELETLRKKAEDFDKSVELKRLSKLKKQDIVSGDNADTTSQETDEGILEKARQAGREEASKILKEANKAAYETNFDDASIDFIKNNPWANSDERLEIIREKLNMDGAITKSDILAKLERAAQDAYPNEYKKFMEDQIRAKVLAEKDNINNGGGGGGSSINKMAEDNDEIDISQATAEDKRIATKFFGGDVKRYLKQKNN